MLRIHHFFSLRRAFFTSCPTVYIPIDIYLINKLLYNLNLVQVEQYMKSNMKCMGVFHFPIDSVLHGRQYRYSTAIFPLKTHMWKNESERYKLEMSRDRLITFLHAFIHLWKLPFLRLNIFYCIFKPAEQWGWATSSHNISYGPPPEKITFSVGTSQYKVAICPFPMYYNRVKDEKMEKDGKINLSILVFCPTINLPTLKVYKKFEDTGSYRSREIWLERKKNGKQQEAHSLLHHAASHIQHLYQISKS